MVKQKIIRNTLYNIIGYGYSAIVGFFIVPYILKNLGINLYGIWSLISMLIGYFSLIDFGLGHSFERYIAEYKAKNEIEKMNYVINSGFLFYFLLFLIFLPLSYFLQNFLIEILKIPVKFHNEAKFVFKWTIIYIGFSNIFGLFYSCIRGFQRMDITGKVAIFLTSFYAIGVILFLKNGWGIKGLMVNNFLIYSLGGLIYLVMLYKIFPEIRLDFLLFEKEIFKKLSKFGIKRWITSIEEVITYQTDKLFISHFLNIGLVSIYQIGYTIPDKVANMIRMLNSAVVPASAEFKAMNDKEKIIKLHLYGLKYIATFAFLVMFFIFWTAPLIIEIWVGPGYEKSVIVLKLFSLIFLITLLSSNLTAILVGIEKPEFQMYAGLSQGILNLILTFLFIQRFGFIGVIIATLISISLSTLYLILIFHKIYKIPFNHTLRRAIFPPFFIALSLNFLLYMSNNFLKFQERSFLKLTILIIEFFFVFTVYFYILKKLRWFKELKLCKNDKKNYKRI
ncbi:MAG: flippase [Candidatus Ratteibacteria bacterium]